MHGVAKRHQTPVGKPHLLHLSIKFLLVSDAVQSGRRDQHRPSLPFDCLFGACGEVFQYNPGLGLNTVVLQVNVVGECSERPCLLVRFILRHTFDEFKIPFKGGVVL